jgi:tellurite resistance protein
VLTKDVYLALAAVGWADGELDPTEADAITRTALEDGLELEQIEALEAQMKAKVEIGSIDWRSMSKEDRLFVYAVASWMTRLDGEISEDETAALDRIGVALHIPERPREHADAIAIEVAALPAGDRPDRFDIPRLRETIATRLAASAAARAAQQEEA